MKSKSIFECSTEQRDSQRQKVYRWEEEICKDINDKMSFEECVEYIGSICNQNNIDNVFIEKANPRRKSSCARCSKLLKRAFIELASHQYCRYICLHEIAHVIVDYNSNGMKFTGHSGVFVKIYCNLLIKYLDINPVIIRRSLVKHRIRSVYDIGALMK